MAKKSSKQQHTEAKAEVKLAEVEAQKKRLKNLIVLGKERGYLTYAEINDHLPDDMTDAEQIEGVVTMLADMGIAVYDEAPDAEQLLMTEAPAPIAEEDVIEEAEEALSTTIDAEFGRTTDPVRITGCCRAAIDQSTSHTRSSRISTTTIAWTTDAWSCSAGIRARIASPISMSTVPRRSPA